MTRAAEARAAAETEGGSAAGRSWTVLELIRWSAGYLQEKGVAQGRLDAEHLLAHALDTSRLQLYLQYDRPLAQDELAAFKPLLLRRAAREPLQYIIGRAAFRELDLRVDRRVLIPRPETEQLVEAVLEQVRGRADLVAVDVGTGSGCIALSLAHEGPFARVVATDVSEDALEVARANAATVTGGDRVEFLCGPLFAPVAGERFDVVVSNPPYIAVEEAPALQPEVRDWEPETALIASERGFEVLDGLVEGAAAHLNPGGLLAVEVGLGQAEAVAESIGSTGAFQAPEILRDLSGRRRIVRARRDV